MLNIKTADGVILYPEYNSFISANFDDQKLHRAFLEQLDMTSISFQKADLRGGFLNDSNMSNAIMTGVSLLSAGLRGAKLTNAKIDHADLKLADFTNADLSGADLFESDITRTDFTGANISDADMRCFGIESAIFANSLYNSNTLWPDGFDYKKRGVILLED